MNDEFISIHPPLTSEAVSTPNLIVTEHRLEVPLDHSNPTGPQIGVFAREVADPKGQDRPFLVYLRGGPGLDTPRPTRAPTNPSWLDRALLDYRVLLVDQRGTGLSAPIGSLSFLEPPQQAAYLANFRADSIISDVELLREALGVETWSVLGQSFGGFCALHYLSTAPHALRQVFFTGGLPPVDKDVDEVYRATFTTLLERNRRYYARYPNDRQRVMEFHRLFEAGEITLPTGDQLTSRAFRQIGNVLGLTHGAEYLHYLLERDPLSPEFLHAVAEEAIPFTGRKPLFALLQEACYANGHATRWSALRTMPDEFKEDITLFTGEHVFPWTYTDCKELSGFSEAAELLAQKEWGPLYDVDVLQTTEVSCAAAIYAEDAFVSRAFSEDTARLIPGLQAWVTGAYEHDGLSVAGDRILDRLIWLTQDKVP